MQKKENKGEKRLVIIDGNHLIHRAFYAIQAKLTTRSGEPTNALFGFCSMVFNILEAEKPDYLVVTFDERAPTFRHEAHAGYKATRVKAPDDLYAQIPRIREMLQCWGVPMAFKEGFEADDMMGTLAKKAAAEGLESFVVTGDMDALQLITPRVHVVFPHKGYKEPMLYDREKVFAKYGVYPEQIVDFKALMGDASDNIKGVQGIGPKGAAELLSRYGTLDGIYGHLPEIAPRMREKLEKGREDAYFARSLTQIVTDAPCELDLERAAFSSFDFKGLERFLEAMEMKSLLGRLKKLTPAEKSVSKEQMSLF
ncbi:MAG: 5'-3' exonuclease H3TH domain-containing protein [Candidatus Peregrinibacteria bacterium]